MNNFKGSSYALIILNDNLSIESLSHSLKPKRIIEGFKNINANVMSNNIL